MRVDGQEQLWAALESEVVRARPEAAPARTLLKWPGGKSSERAVLEAAHPRYRGRFIDPFVGGGALAISAAAEHAVEANDASEDLVGLYRAVQAADPEVVGGLQRLAGTWRDWSGRPGLTQDLAAAYRRGSHHLLDLRAARSARSGAAFPYACAEDLYDELLVREVPRKLERIAVVEAKRHELSAGDLLANVEGAFRAVWYSAVRQRYNDLRRSGARTAERTVLFFFLRELCYAAMFRFSERNGFNVPYGGVSYNRKDLVSKVGGMTAEPFREVLARVVFSCADFAGFLEAVEPGPEDFLFLDPPYDSDFSDYDGRLFGRGDHQRLAALVGPLEVPVQLVVKDSPLVRETYLRPGWSAVAWDKTYMWTIKSRNDRRASHLMITNYLQAAPGRLAR